MDREKIIKRFQEKGFNKETIDLLLGVIDDFELTELTRFVPIEEVVDRICKNLSQSIIFEPITHCSFMAYYNSKEKKIVIDSNYKDKPETVSSALFHEVMHCITNFEKTSNVRIPTDLSIELWRLG